MNDKNTVVGETYGKMQRTTSFLLQESIILCTFLHCYAQKAKTTKKQESANSAVPQSGEGFSQLKIHSNQEVLSVKGCLTNGNCEPKVKACKLVTVK